MIKQISATSMPVWAVYRSGSYARVQLWALSEDGHIGGLVLDDSGRLEDAKGRKGFDGFVVDLEQFQSESSDGESGFGDYVSLLL